MTTHRSMTTRLLDGAARARVAVRRRAGVVLAALAAALLGLVGIASPAAAHGGDIVISLGTDGQGGISANLTYKNDGHPVEESADVTVTAESEDGETVGPVTLLSASEGVGWYVSDPETLDEGHWVLTATTTEPSEAEATAEVDVVALVTPSGDAQEDTAGAAEGSAGDGTADGGAAAEDAGADGEADGEATAADGSSSTVWWVAGLVVLAAAVVAAVMLVRRRSTTTSGPSGR
ncbi:hypothetical protein [Cellulosimicrobium arenosum]|uniref:CopC domain-containing protein n=1 Tax=Cellulosimicrobium arenosum TaxID=2708133 RepID=A0A927J1G2_9MICO|nr:hypothetical protein [Cellulosimicrobium arenosum]MBD8080159.1 hypothetical protein [Cellulosimicrobium arenosum]